MGSNIQTMDPADLLKLFLLMSVDVTLAAMLAGLLIAGMLRFLDYLGNRNKP